VDDAVALFNPQRLAREYPESAITRPFPFNSFYTPNSPDKAPIIDPVSYRLNVTGLVDDTSDWTLARLYALPRVTQITRHICIEGWSAVGKCSGVRFSDFLRGVGADLRAKYVTFRCDDQYTTSIWRPRSTRKRSWLSGSTTACCRANMDFR
jgi:DMSO/TMAO reductase YedYZ molybdopterin-dependent catalytic subunit